MTHVIDTNWCKKKDCYVIVADRLSSLTSHRLDQRGWIEEGLAVSPGTLQSVHLFLGRNDIFLI